MPDTPTSAPAPSTSDVIVVGSGAAGLAAALTAAVGGLSVTILEKSEKIGGTSAMSGAGTWIPANHHARREGTADSPEEALRYLRAASPDGWAATEEPLWAAFVEHAPAALEFLERFTPLRFELVAEPDPMAERPGGMTIGRMVSPRQLRRGIVGRLAGRIRHSTMPHLFTYRELLEYDPYHRPITATLALAPKLSWRWLTNAAGQGNALVVGLLRGCLDHGCRLELAAAVRDLIVDKVSGCVEGVVVARESGEERLMARKGVVLASGGFEWDEVLRSRHFPGPVDRLGSPRTNTGDGQRLAERAGARLERLDQANVYPTVPTIYEGQLHGLPALFHAEPHAIVVNHAGRRFVSEYDYNLGEALDCRDRETGQPLNLPAWVVADARFVRQNLVLRWYAAKEPGWIRRAPTLEALAGQIGVPVSTLVETVARFNGFCAAGRDADFHRGESIWERYKAGIAPGTSNNPTLAPIEQSPFAALSLNRSILGTKGGARTTPNGQVVRVDGGVIPGLYAAGNAMANPIGTRALGAGTTIGPCLTWGYICGLALRRENP